MAMAVDGLVSGFNTTQMISGLMQLEAAPQTLLKSKVTKAESFVSALQSLNTKVASLADAARSATKVASWQAMKATSSVASVTGSATTGAQPSSLSFTVDRLAARQVTVSTAVTGLADFFDGAVPKTLTLAQGPTASAQVKEVSLTGVTDLTGLAGVINASGTGVTATVVSVAGGMSVLQLTGGATGAAKAFDLYAGSVTAAQISSGKAPVPLMGRTTIRDVDSTGPGASLVTAAADAEVTLWGTQKVTSSTNTFTGVVPGLTFTVSAVESDPAKPVTLSVRKDDAAPAKLVADLVTNISTVLAEVSSRTKVTTSTVDGRQVVTGGVLSADSMVRSVQQSVLSAATMPVGGVSPSSIGIVLGKDGTVTYDETKLTAALAADPAKVQSVATAVAERVQKVAQSLSDPVAGSLTRKIQGQQSYVKTLADQVQGWDGRLALRRTALERTYAAMEVSLSRLNSQAGWLSSQIDQMNASK